MRNKIFISHATPDDNDFTKWLALKLIGLGYEVWCDILFLDKGVDFWSKIEKEIRENAIKFLIVSSSYSNQREGVLKELAVAAKVKKQLSDSTFIIPLAIDEKLSYDDINIDIVRLNAIDFKKSWASGLRDLLEALEKHNVPKSSPDLAKSNQLYQQIFLHDKSVIEKEEIYVSNWFSIMSFPDELRFHQYDKKLPNDYDVRKLTFPAIRYKNYLCTFAWEYDFIYQLPKTETYNRNFTIRIPTADILSGQYNSDFIGNFECQRLIVQLLNKAFELRMKDKNVREYQMSNKIGYWIEKGKLEKDRFNKVQLVGKLKEKNWHFGISAAAKLYPFPVLMVSSHIFFTEDGAKLIETKSIQHSSRRRQGKNWWNDDWKTKLLAFVKYLSDDDISFYLEVGSEEKVFVSNAPIQFKGNVSYIIPENNTLEEEVELSDINELDNFEEKFPINVDEK
ncbi:MAG: toll/interleukin-1 receptor domain-containing protein [Tissierellia bacterium]|jgi:hypothetical protein|nr:toll/interleukin-1 receptor domain-containing protein [Tissierellia bacterium]